MAGPTIHSVAAQTGALQSVISPKRTDDTKKDSEVRRAPTGKDDDDESGQTGKSAGAPKTGGAEGGQSTKRTRRKKVSLDQTGSKQTEKASSKDTREVQRQSQTSETEKTQQSKADQAADSKALGYAKAAGKLNEQSKMVQASVLHEQNEQQNPQPALSHTGRRRNMLKHLVSWTGINHDQHTGDKAGECFNRRGTREAHMALKGLQCSNQANGTSSSDRINAKGVKFDRHKLETVSRFHAEEQPTEEGYEAFEATG